MTGITSVQFTENRRFGPVHVVVSKDGIVFIYGTTCYTHKGIPQYILDVCGSLDDCTDTVLNIMEDWDEVDDMLEYLTLKNNYDKTELL